ncbi:hypothetical protein LZL87_013887 [Fusarium oxysporum]|nr:hypothetical protein LZL87_013887 [Fusarium oxysporum]
MRFLSEQQGYYSRVIQRVCSITSPTNGAKGVGGSLIAICVDAPESGASSTNGKSIQMDISNTYKDLMVLNPDDPIALHRALVYVGVSNQLKEINAYLRHNQLFVPHVDCAYVCVGWHGQTGGYGQLRRGFGLFGDHIRTIRIVCHDGVIRDISKENDLELFYAILGGSPGNFGIISYYTVDVFQAKSYMGTIAGPNGFKGPHGTKGFWICSPKVLKKLLTAVAQMADNAKVPRGFDLFVNVLSTDFPIAMLFPILNNASIWEQIQNKIKNALADEFLQWRNGRFPAVIIVMRNGALPARRINETLLIDDFEEDILEKDG